MGYSDLSLWHATTPDPWSPRPPLPGDMQVDVAVVGAGYTGLWTAYYLLREDPTLRVAVLEAETAGFGASGRNGGWCSALFPASAESLAALPGAGRAGAMAQHRAMRDTVDEVGRVLAREGVDADYHKGGAVSLARNPAQLERARAVVDHARWWGRGEEEVRLLDEAEARRRVAATRIRGATYHADCAVVHPARLVRGLASTVERLGGRIYERTRVLRAGGGRVETVHGTVTADVAVRATEGYTAGLHGERRTLAPVYSMIIATEPLPAPAWEGIGLGDREALTDHRNLIIYGQRTADGRLVLGGRGAPYRPGSAVRPAHDRHTRTFAHLYRTVADLFPSLAGVRVTHAWGGVLGVPRDWCPSVGLDRGRGLAWAGGYVGDGVGTSNLAGRTLRDLVLGRDTGLTVLPWVQHRWPLWEPEPLRWLGVNAGLRAMAAADLEERLTGRPSLVARMMAPLVGGH